MKQKMRCCLFFPFRRYLHSENIACPPLITVAAVFAGFFIVASTVAAETPNFVQSSASEDGLWQEVVQDEAVTTKTLVLSGPQAYRTFSLNEQAMDSVLAVAPSEFTKAAYLGESIIALPLPDGTYTRVKIEESPILSPELELQYPELKTYRGQGIDDATLTARFDFIPSGFHAILFSEQGTAYIDPLPEQPGQYISYWKHDVAGEPFQCSLDESSHDALFENLRAQLKISPTNPSGTQLRTYRLAMTATGEYTTFFEALDCPNPAPAGCAQTAAAARLATTVNRVTGIYEREVAVRFVLTDTTIYDDPATDPFPTGASVDGNLLAQNQTDLDATVGSANYDIGHIVSAGGGGGLATLGVACNNSSKARGGTSLGNPSGDVFDVDYVSHEIGHQMNANHTFNGTVGSCAGGNRNASTAYEPGSGSTIMAYAGICGAQNVQSNSDDNFHTISFDEITAFRNNGTTGGSCGTLTPTGNTVPIVDAGGDFTIPQGTPFTLTATGSDGNGDTLTYAWEQFDLGPAGVPASTDTTGPLFRSRAPTADASRTLPQLSDILSGVATPWEVLPTVNRTLNFRATARDNRAAGGGVDYDAMVVTVSGDPFFIMSPDISDTLECAADELLTWSVGGGSIAANVEVLLSNNGGVSFQSLIPSTANDGMETVTLPTDTITNMGRFKLQPTNNIFFAISDDFSIDDTLTPIVTAPADLPAVECTSPAGASPEIGAATAVDQCDTSLIISDDAPGVFPFGETIVTWSAFDEVGNVGTDTQSVIVMDTTPPEITAPADITAECTSPAGTPVDIGTPTTTDICDLIVDVSNDAPALFPLGDTVITWLASDDSGNTSAANQTVTIEDTTPPELELSVTPSKLWPPNHKMVTIQADITVSDICDPDPIVRLVSITSNEPDNGIGDGNTINDIQGAVFNEDDREFELRAERSGMGIGRVYTILYEAEDASGNTTQAQATVIVPKSQGT